MQYTARNISVLVATVARGLVYLITFVFGANSLGLAALGVQMIVDPEAVRAAEGGRRRSPSEQLPKVKLTDDIFAIRRAFKEAEEMGKRSVERAKKDTEKS